MNENSSGLKRKKKTISEMIRSEEIIRLESIQRLEGSVGITPEFISKTAPETGAGLNCESASEEDEDNEEDSGLGKVLGISFGIAIGAALDNISLYMMIGLALGMLLDARMGSGKSKG